MRRMRNCVHQLLAAQPHGPLILDQASNPRASAESPQQMHFLYHGKMLQALPAAQQRFERDMTTWRVLDPRVSGPLWHGGNCGRYTLGDLDNSWKKRPMFASKSALSLQRYAKMRKQRRCVAISSTTRRRVSIRGVARTHPFLCSRQKGRHNAQTIANVAFLMSAPHLLAHMTRPCAIRRMS